MSEQSIRLPPRSLLLPLSLLLVIGLAVAAGMGWSDARAHTTVILLIRNAEVESGAADSELSAAGQRRAAALGDYLETLLGSQPIDHIYASYGRPAQSTAAPVANQFRLPINLLAESDWEDLPKRVRRDHIGQYIAVVGTAGTIADFGRELSGTEIGIADEEFGDIYVVVLSRAAESRLFRVHYEAPDRDSQAGS
jgi:hypothetical protein